MTKEQVDRWMGLSEAVPAMERHGIDPGEFKKEWLELGAIIYGEWKNNHEQYLKDMSAWGFLPQHRIPLHM